MHRLAVLAAVILPLLAGCGRTADSEQVRICRMLVPALHPDGTAIREIKAGPLAADRHGVRIDYTSRAPGREIRVRYIACRFRGGPFDPGRADLVAVDTERGPFGEARLYFLKRFWLDAFGVAASEAEALALPPVPQVPLAVAYAGQQAANAVALAAVYALIATAYSLIYGLVGRINLAFGEIAVTGAYGAIGGAGAAVVLGSSDPSSAVLAAVAVAMALGVVVSAVVGRVVIAPLHARHRLGQPILVATAAVAVTIQEFLRLFQGVRERWLPPVFNEPIALARADRFVVTVTPMQIGVALTAFVAAAAVLWLLARTRFGREWRAFADDPGAAALVGVSPAGLMLQTFGLAGALAGLAGGIVAVYYGNVSFSMGTMLGLKALVAAVIGGIGSVPGAFVGGLVVAGVEAAWSAYFDIAVRDIVVFSLLAVVFVLRPGGLFGFAGPTPRDV